ncbi:bifunctional glutamate/proline--tRNA ligase-like isoform X2 [Nematostella vectensis]|uniref:bifunctional glutamate/proline--tRNA ligase-like isoform X2 n=1 Tax=Nematostella vectensis TaxID=45351 RepID=UPI002076DE75|nr:bifunctional glutamate/proline--tRNA ligase-like isoform X2 [Nematostella vectensis]
MPVSRNCLFRENAFYLVKGHVYTRNVTLLAAEHLKNSGLVKLEWGDNTSLKINENFTLTGDHNIARYLARLSPSNGLYGKGALQASEVDHWLEFSSRCQNGCNVDQALKLLDRSLAPVAFLVGPSVTLADFAVWAAINANNKLATSVKNAQHICRWYKHCLAQEPFKQIASSLPGNNTNNGSNNGSSGTKMKQEGKYIDLPGASMGNVVTRFPPEASGYLHIGHAKAALLNQYYKNMYEGTLIMRFDDTNPAKENAHFEEVILKDLEMLEFKFDKFTHTSDHFDTLIGYCEKMLRMDKAYADDTAPERMKEERDQKIKSANRDNSVEKNLQMWDEMKRGTEYGQSCCIRAKIDYQSPNGTLRDPTIYRCKPETHIRTGNKYKVYPIYDFACPIVDSLEGVTHALRTTEYHDRDPQYYWLLDALGLRKPHIYEFSRLTLQNTVMSKRKLTWLVDQGLVDGWDDPRFPTVRGVLRRGMTVEGLREFIVLQGSSKANVHMEWDKIWAINKKVIDPIAPRYTALQHSAMIPFLLPAAKEEKHQCALHPKNPDVGTKAIWRGPRVMLEGEDAESLSVGDMVTLINWGNTKVSKINRNSKGKIESIEGELHLDNKDYKKTTKLTWLADTPTAPTIPAVMVNFDNLISKGIITKTDDFKQFVNKNSKTEVILAGEPELASVKKGDVIQLQRRGFFICDQPYEPTSRHTGQASPCVLFSVPDGHTKTQPSGAKGKSDGGKREQANKSNNKNANAEPAQAKPLADPAAVEKLMGEITQQGDKVRTLKTGGADKKDVDAAVATLLKLKAQYKDLTGEEVAGGKPKKEKKKDTKQEAKQPGKQAESAPALSEAAQELLATITQQGDKVRSLKTQGAHKGTVDAEVAVLLKLKADYKTMTGTDVPGAGNPKKDKKKDNKPEEKKPKEAKKPKESKQEKPKMTEGGDDDGAGLKKKSRLGLEAKKSENLSEWYSQVITRSEMIEYYDVSGCYILRAWSYAIWERIKEFFDAEIKKLGVENVYFPMFVSHAALEREKTHIADFAPEVAWVTRSGQSELAEPIAIRPTSETVMYPAYAKWIQSHRDLPLLFNQWNNVVRWEFKHPQPFLRTREFLWQEGHTAYADQESAIEEVHTILGLYQQIYEYLMAIPTICGRKTEKEKFAGGDFTTTVEVYISASGRGIQGATSHHLGQNFSKMFDIVFEDPDPNVQEKRYVYQNSWGITTRTIGVLTMVHGDDQGLVLPPRVATLQVVIIPCGITVTLPEAEKAAILDRCKQYERELKAAGIRAKGDFNEHHSPGWKFNHWELKGVPIRIEVGPRDVKNNKFVLVRRHDRSKHTIQHEGFVGSIQETLEVIQNEMFETAKKDLEEHLAVTTSWQEFTSMLDNKKIIQAPFCGESPCEDKIKKDSTKEEVLEPGAPAMGAKALCIPFNQPAQITADTKCVHPDCGRAAKFYTLFGRSY